MTTIIITPKPSDGEIVKEMFHFMGMTLPGVEVSEALVVTGLPADLASSLTRSMEEAGHEVSQVIGEIAPEPKATKQATAPAAAIQPQPKPKRPYTRKPKPEPQEEARKEEAPAEAPFVWVKSEDVQTTVQITEAGPLAA